MPHRTPFTRHLKTTGALLGIALLLAGCDSAATDAIDLNFARSDLFTRLNSEIDLSAPTNINPLSGDATYTGVATTEFRDGFGLVEFEATSDASLTADFDSNTISGSLTSFQDLDPVNNVLRGQVLITQGTIASNGAFVADMDGNIERQIRTVGTPPVSPTVKVFSGTASGQIYDSTAGDVGSHMTGSILGNSTDGGSVSGAFVAAQ